VADYRIEFAASAKRQFEKLPAQVRRRLTPEIDSLATEPRPAGVKHLAGPDDLWRIRVGAYRIVYRIEDDRLVVLVVKLGHRRNAYR